MPSEPHSTIDRRRLPGTGVAASTGLALAPSGSGAESRPSRTFPLCLNMSTIRGHDLDAAAEIEVAGNPGYDAIKDEHRVYPGDGIAPVVELLRTFAGIGAFPVLSLELFNKAYWEQPAGEVARTGLAKMKACVSRALQP